MVDVEDLTEEKLDVLHKFYQRLSDVSEQDQEIHNSHSIEAADELNQEKKKAQGETKHG